MRDCTSALSLRQAPVLWSRSEDELSQALRANRALRDQVTRERQYRVEQEARHMAEKQALHAQYRDEIEFLIKCRVSPSHLL